MKQFTRQDALEVIIILLFPMLKLMELEQVWSIHTSEDKDHVDITMAPIKLIASNKCMEKQI